MNLLRETPNVNLAVLKSSVLSLADNQHRESNSIAYGQYDIPNLGCKTSLRRERLFPF